MFYQAFSRTSSLSEYAGLGVFGGCLYGLVECAYRGHTHWTMMLTGGVCFSVLYARCKHETKPCLPKTCLFGCGVITLAELAVGCVVNRLLHWQVWDYSNRPGNLLGQICPLYSFFWFLLCMPAVLLCRFLCRLKAGKEGIR